jgi:hypothetical protein
MKHNAFNMSLKANEKVFNGNSQHPQDPRKLACQSHNITFFDTKGNIHSEFIPQGQSTKQAYYL